MKTSEMIAMLEKNPGLTFKNKDDSVRVNRFKNPSVCSFSLDFLLQDNDWELVPEPVPAWEAIKALTEGKVIRCEMTTDTGFCLHPEIIERGGKEFDVSWLNQGTWYIEEDSNAN